MSELHTKFIDNCAGLDIEVDPQTAEIFAMVAIKPSTGETIDYSNRNIQEFLDKLEKLLGQSYYLVGHNLLRFDLEHIIAKQSHFSKYVNRSIDTLWLSPLAYPLKTSHRLAKPHLDPTLRDGRKQDPELDALLALQLLENQQSELAKQDESLLLAYHYLSTRRENLYGFNAFFNNLRNATAPSTEAGLTAIHQNLNGKACQTELDEKIIRFSTPKYSWALAYALSWISVAEQKFALSPWVFNEFPEVVNVLRSLRATKCENEDCEWCLEHNEPKVALQRWFEHDDFREYPQDNEGNSLQSRIVSEAASGGSVLGILPTGTGKSVCYQIPALLNYYNIGALTVVISPLVALMTDQIAGLESKGITSAISVNGNLTLAERSDALEKVMHGEASMLLISPEQLRSSAIRTALKQRVVGPWVLDEAHCVSKWGHDFRPDYRYVSRFIAEFDQAAFDPQVICLTATAKPEVIKDIEDHFVKRLKIEFKKFNGGASRQNLTFEVRSTTELTKEADILDTIGRILPNEGDSGAIVYCSTRSQTEKLAKFLINRGFAATHFHARIAPEEKKAIQEKFHKGELRIIVATNAFGMGIDKPDIRLVVHADIPSSLENYLQEAGRAGRDGGRADCVLFFENEDIDKQFSLTTKTELTIKEIQAILSSIRKLRKKKDPKGDQVIAIAGEIVKEDTNADSRNDSSDVDNKVKTAIYWLEEAELLVRDENKISVYPSSLMISSREEAELKLDDKKNAITKARRRTLLKIVNHLLQAPANEAVSTDDLLRVSELSNSRLFKALYDLEALGIMKNDLPVTVYVTVGVVNASQKKLQAFTEMERETIALMRELAPDASKNDKSPLVLHLRTFSQLLQDRGHKDARPDIIKKIVLGLAADGRHQDGGEGSFRIRMLDRETVNVWLGRSWQGIEKTAQLRSEGADTLLKYLIGLVPSGKRGSNIAVETTLGDLLAALNNNMLFKNGDREMDKLTERSLLWMHELEVATIGNGLTIFHPAFTLRLRYETKRFTKQKYKPLEDWYREKTVQIHIMASYAKEGLNNNGKAVALAQDYFDLEQDKFLKKWLPRSSKEIKLRTTPEKHAQIVTELDNKTQQEIVEFDEEETSMLVLAGPGSGKTRVLVHRIAYQIRVKRENPDSILVLVYNRHAASEIKKRLRELIGNDAFGVTVKTCHGFAMQVIGRSFVNKSPEQPKFDEILKEAVKLISGEELEQDEAEGQRDSLIYGYRWIFVDEYQDIGPDEYALIAAIAGKSIDDKELKLSLFAVGDDDQNIYSFNGASVEYIRRFEEDYRAKRFYMVDNYRSTRNIIGAANSVISYSKERMKVDQDIIINRHRASEPPGGRLFQKDRVAHGRVQVLQCPRGRREEAVIAVDELKRLSKLDDDWDWSKVAIISRNWKDLNFVKGYAEHCGIPVSLAYKDKLSIWRFRETTTLVQLIQRSQSDTLKADDIYELLKKQPENRWTALLEKGIDTLRDEIGDNSVTRDVAIEWLAEWSHDAKTSQRGLLLMVAHRAKGLEFDHVVILDGEWRRRNGEEDDDAPCRLYYVAMTRARKSLARTTRGNQLSSLKNNSNFLVRKVDSPSIDISNVDKKYIMPEMGLVDLSFAARLGDTNRSLEAIEKASVDDKVSLYFNSEKKRWEVKDELGEVIGAMAKTNFNPPSGYNLVQSKIGAICTRYRTDSGGEQSKEHRDYIRRERWEVILPELTYQRPSQF